jgi:FtsP/CotA-like multicopper oxidase with cupredoxin domain
MFADDPDFDVVFQSLLINGQSPADPALVAIPRGTHVRLRVINSCSMTHLKLQLPLDMRVVAVDGEPTMPWDTNQANNTFWLATAQRVDFLFTMPASTDLTTGLVFRALNEAVDGYDQLQGILVMYTDHQQAPTDTVYDVVIPPAQVDDKVGGLAGYMSYNQEFQLHAWKPLVPRKVDRAFVLEITGDNGFMALNGSSYQLYPMADYAPNPHPLVVYEGERVQITIVNNNADGHAFHLHGHSFQVVGLFGQRVDGPMRDTAFIPGGDCNSVTFQFDANNPGVWPLHCHMDFHMMAGMITTVEYQTR